MTHRALTTLFATLALLAGLSAAAQADMATHARPSDQVICSANETVCADMRVDPDHTTVRAGDDVLWRVDRWFRDAYLTDDGAHLVAGEHGFVMLKAADGHAETVILTFWTDGQLIRTVTLAEIVGDLDNLWRSVSHYRWGTTDGFDENGRFVLHTVENRRIAFDVATGEIVETWAADHRF